jgi:hypothetical protein
MVVLLAVGLVFGCASTQEKIAKQAAQEAVVERNTDRQDATAWVREGFVIPRRLGIYLIWWLTGC